MIDLALTKRRTAQYIGEILLKENVIDETQLEKALLVQSQSSNGKRPLIGDILIKLGFATEIDILCAFLAQYRYPYLSIKNYKIDPAVMKLIPVKFAYRHMVVPIDKICHMLTVATSKLPNTEIIEELEKITGYKIQIVLSATYEIRNALREYYHNRIYVD